MTKEARELAEAHWQWLESILHKIYVEAMVHGFKHGLGYSENLHVKDKEVSHASS